MTGGPGVAASQDVGPRCQRERGRKGRGPRCCWAAVACWAKRRIETETGRAEGGSRPWARREEDLIFSFSQLLFLILFQIDFEFI